MPTSIAAIFAAAGLAPEGVVRWGERAGDETGGVYEIDAVVMGARFTGWQTSREGDRTVKFEIRRAFKKFGLEPTGELFDSAYAYVAEHY